MQEYREKRDSFCMRKCVNSIVDLEGMIISWEKF